ncbi:MAG: S-layer homology domain-containing protein [Candidatus Pristimantibacillus sp.]
MFKRSFLTIVAALCLFTGMLTPNVYAQATTISVSTAYETASSFMVRNVPNPSYNNEWFIISLARGGYEVSSTYYGSYYRNLVKEVQEREGELHSRKYTEYSRVILALSAIGKDARNVGGYNLVEKLYDFDQVIRQGINGPIFALIALDSWGYDIPATATNSRDRMISYILSKQLDNGGFPLSGTQADPDITAMAIQGLSTYADRNEVDEAIDRALAALNQIGVEGKDKSPDSKNSENTAQLLTALSSLSIDPMKDDRFSGAVDELLLFYDKKDGGFKHILEENASNGMATEQAGYAIAAYERMLAGKTKLYDMTDTKQAPSSFTDVTNHWASEAIQQAFQHGLMKGYQDGTFKPEQQLTRIQAASLVARALHLESTNKAPYSDIVKYNQETQSEVAALYEAGIIQLNKGIFNPDRKLTRAELALMLARSYDYATDKKYEATALVPFTDIAHLNNETKQAIAFLYQNRLAEGSNGKFQPSQNTTRAQAAKLFVGFVNLMK